MHKKSRLLFTTEKFRKSGAVRIVILSNINPHSTNASMGGCSSSEAAANTSVTTSSGPQKGKQSGIEP